MVRRASIATLFPYTTLFRSGRRLAVAVGRAVDAGQAEVEHLDRVVLGDHQQVRRLDVTKNKAIKVLDLRSEEHTSELQSHHDLVCRLLIEKKKQNSQHDDGV